MHYIALTRSCYNLNLTLCFSSRAFFQNSNFSLQDPALPDRLCTRHPASIACKCLRTHSVDLTPIRLRCARWREVVLELAGFARAKKFAPTWAGPCSYGVVIVVGVRRVCVGRSCDQEGHVSLIIHSRDDMVFFNLFFSLFLGSRVALQSDFVAVLL